jgi:Ca2+-binding RTX toxin-like protein
MTGLGSGGDAEGDTLVKIENLTGSNFDDSLEGNAGNNVLAGGTNGPAGDTVSYEHATAGVTVNLAATSAQNTVGAGLDTLTGFENITGSAFNDTLVWNNWRQHDRRWEWWRQDHGWRRSRYSDWRSGS